jgi:hypothetical protein
MLKHRNKVPYFHSWFHPGYLISLSKGAFRAPKADSLLNPAGALPNKFSKRSDSLLILWSDSLK